MRPSEFTFDVRRKRRKPSLTPMIDVVFLLLVFFMLAARFGLDKAIPLRPAVQGGSVYAGAPRLISVAPKTVHLNGQAINMEVLAKEVRTLMPSNDAIVVVKPIDGASLQDIVDVLDQLSGSGITQVVLVE